VLRGYLGDAAINELMKGGAFSLAPIDEDAPVDFAFDRACTSLRSNLVSWVVRWLHSPCGGSALLTAFTGSWACSLMGAVATFSVTLQCGKSLKGRRSGLKKYLAVTLAFATQGIQHGALNA
jgi:hypothetical protein